MFMLRSCQKQFSSRGEEHRDGPSFPKNLLRGVHKPEDVTFVVPGHTPFTIYASPHVIMSWLYLHLFPILGQCLFLKVWQAISEVSGKHFPGPDFPLWKWEMLTYFIYFAQFEGQHFPLGNFIKKGKVNLLFDLPLFLTYFVIQI